VIAQPAAARVSGTVTEPGRGVVWGCIRGRAWPLRRLSARSDWEQRPPQVPQRVPEPGTRRLPLRL